MKWGRLVGEGLDVPINDEDVRWAAIMLLGEAGHDAEKSLEGEAVLWTMAQRLWLLRNTTFSRRDGVTLRPPHSYTDIIRAYSQPINPYWLRHGDAEELRRRKTFQTMKYADVPAGIRDLVERWARGQVPMKKAFLGLVHFIAPGSVDQAAEGAIRVRIPDVRGNVFFKMPSTRSWTAAKVSVAPGALAPAETVCVWLLAA